MFLIRATGGVGPRASPYTRRVQPGSLTLSARAALLLALDGPGARLRVSALLGRRAVRRTRDSLKGAP